MKYDHFIVLNENTLAVKLADESKTIGSAIYSAQQYCSRFEDNRSLSFIRKGNITIDNKCTPWVVLSNGRYINIINHQLFRNLIQENNSEVIMLNTDKDLEPYREDIRIKLCNEVAGYRRFFFDSLIPAAFSNDWPNFTIIKLSSLKSIMENGSIPERFCIFLKRCIFNNLKMRTYKIGGRVLDLDTENGVLTMVNQYLRSNEFSSSHRPIDHEHVRLYGKIISDENVRIESGATIVGPSIIGENVTIPSSATIYNSIIRPGTNVRENSFIRTQIMGSADVDDCKISQKISYPMRSEITDNYRVWPLFSYARLGKRTCDFLIALAALPWFWIIFIFIAATIKITSPGPVFFKHKRQGLYGKTFSCLKFRTMIINADEIQEKLGFKNQVDGPQFKIDDDPRVTIIGRFLRDTHIDELPQFINILCGQMSLIGPRPSPAKENSFCSYWRDARLSVRPGITGLWQMNRTRESGQDFQEWIYYDTQYVKNLSLKLDIQIFFQTAFKLMLNFFKHL